MKNYEINKDTMAVIPYEDSSKIYEVDDEFTVDNCTRYIIEESCEYFGSSLEGRQKGTTKLTGLNYKVPIIVEESNKLIFFPTSSPKSEQCAWISLNFVDKYYKVGDKLCLEFKNGRRILLDISYRIVDNQILRSSRLESVLRDRIDK